MAFDPAKPDDFLKNFNNASVLYSADPTQSNQQLTDLQSALAYLQSPAGQQAEDASNYAGYSQFMAQQLNNDIAEQTNMNNYGQAQGNVDSLTKQYGTNNDWLTKYSNDQSGHVQWAKDNGMYQQLMDRYSKSPGYSLLSNEQKDTLVANQTMREWQLAMANHQGDQRKFQTQLDTAKQGLNPLQDKALQGFTLNSPDYAHQEQAVKDYYYGKSPTDPNGQIYQATNDANRNIYDQVYNIKNDINTKAAQIGVSNSGSRQKALSNVNGQAVDAATKLRQNAENTAQESIQNQQKQNQAMQGNQQNLTNSVKQGQFSNLFDTGTKNEVSAYNTQTGAQSEQGIQNAEKAIEKQQADSNMWNDIFGTVGKAGGALIGGLI